MTQAVAAFLKQVAKDNTYAVFDSIHGSIQLGREFPITQSSGAVYGIWVKTDQPPSQSCMSIPGHPGWYPVYWGKDIAPMSRMKAHVQGHKNGNIDLPNVQEVQGRPLIFGAILVARYAAFERVLHTHYPPLRGTPAGGRSSSVVRVQADA